ncbi:Structural maintenance of chromosomes protein 3 [Dinochytrium kinnereticum]|nr:Structural maintenance of chromosomes protein 3 [Dinochytrium kinnereticum]
MYIKQIIIQGFKSYKEQTSIEPFSSKHNVIAIRFVLSDAYNNMTREERQSLLHEGTGQATISAFVEIIFDNADNRFPTGKEEVVLRRTIGLKKDEYSLDKKIVNKGDVMNLLESAGFSKSNPYYIVPQGRITALTNAKDSERLQLLKEVAGTKVYENRRQESLKIMEDTDTKRQKIDELLVYIDERLNELEEEKEELRQFQEMDKERRVLEYTIYHREQTEINRNLEELEEQRRYEIEGNAQRQNQFNARDRVIADLEQEIRQLNHRLEGLKTERLASEDDRQELMRDMAALEMQVKDLEDHKKRTTEDQKRLASELKRVEKAIASKEKDLQAILPLYEEAVAKEAELTEKVQCTTVEHQSLLDKQGRTKQFRSKAERDAYLTTELASLNKSLEQSLEQQTHAENDSENAKKRKEELEKGVEELKGKITARRDMVDGLVDEIENCKAERNRMDEKRKELWREEQKSANLMESAREELAKADRNLMSSMDRNVASALQAIKKITAKHNLKGVYGPLYELFTVDDRYKTSVEVIGGGSLFHVVVDTDDTATFIMDILNRDRLGRVTFMPLNRLHPKEGKFPNANDAIPILKKLKYNEAVHAAFVQVFGKAIVCPTLEIATHYARHDGINAVTMDGDRADKKGSMTGGFIDNRKSKLEAAKAVRTARALFEEETGKSERIRGEVGRVEQEIVGMVDRIAVLEKQRGQAGGSLGPMVLEVGQIGKEVEGLREFLIKKEEALAGLRTSIKVFTAQVHSVEEEMKSPLRKSLTNEEISRLDAIVPELEALNTELNEASGSRAKLQSKKSVLEIELRSNLRKQRDKIQAQIAESENGEAAPGESPAQSSGGEVAALEHRRTRLKEVGGRLTAVVERLREIEDEIDEAESNVRDRTSALENVRTEQSEEARSMERQQRHLEKYVQRKSLLQKKKEESTRGIRDLGLLPEEALRDDAEVSTLPSADLLGRLHRANEGLKRFGHVNKKAFEQYASFTRQKEGLEKRKEELDSSAKSIEDLIQVLDQRKDEAIERTFKQVAKHFTNVWRKLVPSGYGKLVMMKKADKRDGADADEEEPEEDASLSQTATQMQRLKCSIDRFDGVGISVSFAGGGGAKSSSKKPQKKGRKGKGRGPAKRKKAKHGGPVGGMVGAVEDGDGDEEEEAEEEEEDGDDENVDDVELDEEEAGVDEDEEDNETVAPGGLKWMQQLSGGQKSLVALALIFAIQKCDPAPFYLFDEIDAALDTQYRTAVANMVHELSSHAQFITTTFRPEMLVHADRFYGVTFVGKVSQVQCITREDAREFVEQEQPQ